MAPKMAPKTGPSPAMFKNCIKKILLGFSGTKSTPSVMVIAGVLLSGLIFKIFSTTAPYMKYPPISNALANKNKIIVQFSFFSDAIFFFGGFSIKICCLWILVLLDYIQGVI